MRFIFAADIFYLLDLREISLYFVDKDYSDTSFPQDGFGYVAMWLPDGELFILTFAGAGH